MKVLEGKSSSEQKKMIAAIALGIVALFTLWYAFFGSSSGTNPPKRTVTVATQQQLSPVARATPSPFSNEVSESDLRLLRLVPSEWSQPEASEPGRNIFAYYVAPKPVTPLKPEPTPSPEPPPPLILSSITPVSVFARTEEFSIEARGDKFPAQARIYLDSTELRSRYISPQQMTATVPASLILNPGIRQIGVRTPDSSLYSNTVQLNVVPPPTPNYTYVGLIGGVSHNDTAILRDNNSRQLINVQRGDLIASRFRLTSISEREIVVVDTSLKIRHTLPLVRETPVAPPGGLRPPAAIPQRIPRPVATPEPDEEPQDD